MKAEKKTKVGIVLSGGGVRGTAHLGILKALEELGIQPSIISGTSAGAIAGAFYAGGYAVNEILEIIKKVHFFNLFNIRLTKQGVFNMSAFEDMYHEYFPENSFEKLKIPLYVSATDILKGEVAYFSSGDLAQSLLASSCIPLVFQPIKFSQKLYVDGGIMNNFPIEPIIGKCDVIIGSYVNSIKKEAHKIPLNDIIDRSFHLAVRSAIDHKIDQCDLIIEPPNMSRFNIFDIKKMDQIFEVGYNYAMSMEKQIRALKIDTD